MGGERLYTDEENLKMLRLRRQGLTFREIADEIGRTTKAVKAHYGKIAEGRGRAPMPRYTRRYDRLQPFEAPMPEGADDRVYVQKVQQLGGFTRENFWGIAG